MTKKIAQIGVMVLIFAAMIYPPHRRVSGEDVRQVGLVMLRIININFTLFAIGAAIVFVLLFANHALKVIKRREKI